MVVNLTRQEREALEDVFLSLRYHDRSQTLIDKIITFLTKSLYKLF